MSSSTSTVVAAADAKTANPAPDTFTALVALLNAQGASFRVMEHVAEGKSDAIALIRGNKPEQAAKAMVLQVDGGISVLAVCQGIGE